MPSCLKNESIQGHLCLLYTYNALFYNFLYTDVTYAVKFELSVNVTKRVILQLKLAAVTLNDIFFLAAAYYCYLCWLLVSLNWI